MPSCKENNAWRDPRYRAQQGPGTKGIATWAWPVGLWLGVMLFASTAVAKVTLPSGKVIPDPALSCYGGKPGGLWAVFACACTAQGVCNIGAPCPGGSSSCDLGKNGTCESHLWHEVNDDGCIPTHRDGLDPVADATVKPETFKPVCGLTFTLINRGDAKFQNGFGWYNVTGQKPASSDLHLLIDCNAKTGTAAPLNLLADPAYKGGDVGFFLVTPEARTQSGACANGDCCASVARVDAGEGYVYFSEPKYNTDNTGSSSYVHLLTYNSKLDPNAFYFAWEDTFAGTTTEYSDFVTKVSGISCHGAGAPCQTGKQGICSYGVTKCDPQGNLSCTGSNTPAQETCNSLDDNCDGKVDNGATCAGQMTCHDGTCVRKCGDDAEFRCNVGFTCDVPSGLCIDSKCQGKQCNADDGCYCGICYGCADVACPRGQLCQGGRCVDPCAGRKCPANEICKDGVCLPDCRNCGGLTCVLPLTCDQSSGACVDASCNKSCVSGSQCIKGQCVDACSGAKCPGGAICSQGKCAPPCDPWARKNDGGGPSPSGDEGVPWAADSGVDQLVRGVPFNGARSGCLCNVHGAPPSGFPFLVALLLLVLHVRTRKY